MTELDVFFFHFITRQEKMGRASCSAAASLSFVRESQIRSSRYHQDARLQLALTVSLARLRHVDPTPVGDCKNDEHAAVKIAAVLHTQDAQEDGGPQLDEGFFFF